MLSQLKNILPESRILINEPLKNHTSFKVGGPAPYLLLPESVEEITALVSLFKKTHHPYMTIGNGSNLLVSDKGTDMAIIKLSNNFQALELKGNTITACSGISLSKLAVEALKNSLSGFENLAGIPGSLGGAVYMNAGAYGSEIKDILREVTFIDDENKLKTLPAEELSLSYRHSIFMENKGIILSAKLELSEGNAESIKALMAENAKKRKDKQPLEYPSAGSTFKRPEGNFAGKLIEDAGLKGLSYNGARVSEKHCGFIINDGTACASDILELMKIVEEKVYEASGVHLKPEVQIIL